MKEYEYCIRNKNGELEKDRIWAKSNEEVVLRLNNKGYFIIDIKEIVKYKKILLKKPWNLKNVIKFSYQMNIMLEAGIPLNSIFTLMKNNSAKKMPIKEVEVYMSQGCKLSDALEKSSFPKLGVTLIRAGEISGDISKVFLKIKEHYEKKKEFEDKLKQASIYPIFIMVFVLAFLVITIEFIFPTFAEIFNTLKIPLPEIMAFCLNINCWEVIRITMATVLILMVGSRVFNSNKRTKLWIDKVIWKLFYKNMYYSSFIYRRVCSVIGLLLESGEPIVSTLVVTKKLWGNEYAKSQVDEVREKMKKGIPIYKALEECKLGTTVLFELLRAGSSTGELEKMFKNAAKYYEGEIKQRCKVITSLMEPIMMAIIGVLVGGIILMIMLPLFEGIQVIGEF